MSNASEIAAFAARFNVSVADAYVLPAVFERVAPIAKMGVRQLVAEATFNNNALGEYIAKVAHDVALKDREG